MMQVTLCLIVVLGIIWATAEDQSAYVTGSVYCSPGTQIIIGPTPLLITTQVTTTPVPRTKCNTELPRGDRLRRDITLESFNYTRTSIKLMEHNYVLSDTAVSTTNADVNGNFVIEGTEDENSEALFYLYIKHACTYDGIQRCFTHKIPSDYNNKKEDEERKTYYIYNIELLQKGDKC